MHIAIRDSKVFMVTTDAKWGLPLENPPRHATYQKIWDQYLENKNKKPNHYCNYMQERPPGSPRMYHEVIIDIRDLGYACVYTVASNIGQWFVEFHEGGKQKFLAESGGTIGFMKHGFFARLLVPIAFVLYEALESYVRQHYSLWFCYCCGTPIQRAHYEVVIYLDIDMALIEPLSGAIKSIKFIICENTKMDYIFRILCRWKLTVDHCIRKVSWSRKSKDDPPMGLVAFDRPYSYAQIRVTEPGIKGVAGPDHPLEQKLYLLPVKEVLQENPLFPPNYMSFPCEIVG